MGIKPCLRSAPVAVAAPFKYLFARTDLPTDLFIKSILGFSSSAVSEYCKTLLYSNLQRDCLKLLILDAISSIKINNIRHQLYLLLFMQLVFLSLCFVVFWVY